MKIIKNILLFSLFLPVLFTSCQQETIEKTEVITLAKSTHSWDGELLPSYLEGQPEVTILRIKIPPKTSLAIHEHPEINAGLMIRGELTVISEQQDTLYLKEGDTIVELVNKWHFGKNDGDDVAEIVVFYAGIKGTPVTILEDKVLAH